MEEINIARSKLLEAIKEADREDAVAILLNRVDNSSLRDTFLDVFEPVLFIVGDLWLKGELSLAQGYLAGKVAEDVFLKAFDAEIALAGASREIQNVVIGNIEDDFHSLGRNLVSIFLRAAGWRVHDLGNDVLPSYFVDKAVETNSRIIGVSAMMYSTAKNIKNLRKEIEDRNFGGKIQLAVGGAVFRLRPELVAEVGGDGTADTAIHVPELFSRLYEISLDNEK